VYHIASLAERSGWDKYQVARQRRYESRIAVNLIDFGKQCTHPNQKRCQLYTIKAWTCVARSIFQTTWDASNHFFSCLVGISPVWLGYVFCVGINTFIVLGPVLWGGEARACRTSNSVVKGRGPTPIHWVSEKKPTVPELLLTGATDNFDTVGFPSEINCFDAGLGSPSAEPGPPLADPAAFGPVLRKGGAAQGRYSGFRRQIPLY
jgi:hypothetical protein